MAPTESTSNKLDFVPRASFLPVEWRALGAAFGRTDAAGGDTQAVTGRCNFVVRQGFDPLEQSTTGRVIEGSADLGAAIKLKTFALALTAGNVRFRTGVDNPHDAQALLVGDANMPSLKLTVAKGFGDCGDSYVAGSFDVKQRRPELSAAWSATTTTDRATVMLKADPVLRTLTVAAAVSTPGPEWRKLFYDERTELVDIPEDDGERHTVWVSHTMRQGDLLAATRVGARLSLHRTLNWIGDFVDYHLEERIPMFVWRIPFTKALYKLLVPTEDDDTQVRYPLKGWELEAHHDFAKHRPTLGVSKRLGALGTLSATYDLEAEEAGLTLGRSGLSLGARVGKLDGLGWRKPVLHVYVEPLSLLM